MKKILLTTAALSLLVGTAMAAPGDNDNDHKKRDNSAMSRGDNSSAMANQAGQNNSNEDQNAAENRRKATANAAENRRKANANDAENQRKADANEAENQRKAKANAAENQRKANANAADNRSNNNRSNNNQSNNNRTRVDVSKYHRNFNAPHRYHAQAYHAPRGYHYRRWTYGERLPSLYWARDYWLTNFLTFGLMTPPEGYVWVRYGDDALLIDQYTGDIVQVEYDVFY